MPQQNEYEQIKTQAVQVISSALLPYAGWILFPETAKKMQAAFVQHTKILAAGAAISQTPEHLELAAADLYYCSQIAALEIAGKLN